MDKKNVTGMKGEFVKALPDLDYCLIGLQGSRMLGLQVSEDADYDYRGVFITPNEKLLAMTGKPKETIEGGSFGDDEMEWVMHEVGKFFELAIKCNPSVIHMFFVPKYNYISDIGKEIIANKDLFISEKWVRKAFGGYALSQMLFLKRNRGNAKRQEKHVRHCFRLFDTGMELLKTGTITLPVKDPDWYIDLGKKINEDGGLDELIKLFEERDREFQSCKSVLPKEPNIFLANKLLLKIRGF